MDLLLHTAKSTDLDMATPDFLFLKWGTDGISLPWQPMSYAEGLRWICWMTSLPWKTHQQSSGHWTAHSMKSTLLSWGAQMVANGQVSPEERLLQGHHRQSANRSLRVYSRDDVHGQISCQKKLISHVRRGGRFTTPEHRGAQHPIQEPQVQMEFSETPWGMTGSASILPPLQVSEGHMPSPRALKWKTTRLQAAQTQPHPQNPKSPISQQAKGARPLLPSQCMTKCCSLMLQFNTPWWRPHKIGILTVKDPIIKLLVGPAWAQTEPDSGMHPKRDSSAKDRHA